MDAKLLWLSLGFFAAVTMIAMIVWSILFPDKRIWPPNISTPTNRIFVWAITLTIFASAILLAMLDWNSFGWPTVPRWGIGLPLIIAGNWFAWRGALNLGMETTSGANWLPMVSTAIHATRNMLQTWQYLRAGRYYQHHFGLCL